MQQLDPKSVWLFFIGFILRWLIFIVIFAIYGVVILSDLDKGVTSLGFLNWLWVVIPALLIFFWIWAKLTYHFYRYELREDGFRNPLGVFWSKCVTNPYD